MSKYKLDAFSRILNDAKKVQPIEGMKDVYTPEEYAKIRQAELVMGQLDDNEYLTPDIDLGTVEFDERGNLKKIGRTRPAMLDLNIYTANRYLVKKYTTTQEVNNPKAKEGEPKTYNRDITHIDVYVVMGVPIVQAITETRELPPTVRAFKFSKTKGTHYAYKGAEFIKSEDCYKMTRYFSPETMLYLMQLMTEARNNDEVSNGDSLADIETEAQNA